MMMYIIGYWFPVLGKNGQTYNAFRDFGDEEQFTILSEAMHRVKELAADDVEFTDYGIVLRMTMKAVPA